MTKTNTRTRSNTKTASFLAITLCFSTILSISPSTTLIAQVSTTGNKASITSFSDPRKFGSLIIGPGLRANLEVLTADSLEGRETGEPGAQKAAAFIASRFKSIGLRPAGNSTASSAYFQKVPLFFRSLKSVNLQVGTARPAYLKDYVYVPRRGGNLLDVRAAGMTIIPAQATAEDLAKTIAPYDLTGRVVLIAPSIKTSTRSAHGALVPSKYIGALRSMLTVLGAKNPAAILLTDDAGVSLGQSPAFKQDILDSKILVSPSNKDGDKRAILLLVSRATYGTILGQGGSEPSRVVTALAKNTMLTLSCGISIRVHTEETKADAANVLGLLPGSALKNETVVVSAHYDHLGRHNGQIYHGADDDGSGTAALLEIAEAFSKAKKAGHGPRRNILFLANVGEEKGLLGSEYYSEHPQVSVSKTIADLNIDMIGRIDSAHVKDTNYVYVIGSGKLSSGLQALSESVNHRYGDLELDYRYDDPMDPNRFYYRSDHYNFAKLGIPIIFYFNGVHKDYHQPSDTIDKISFNLCARRARLVFYTAWELANANERPLVDRVNDFK